MRKKIIFVGIVMVSIILLTINLLAQEPESPSQQPLPEDFDYTDPAAVNSLNVEDLVTAIAEGKITDLSIVNDNQLAAALGKNPALVLPKLPDNDLARALTSDLTLMDKSFDIAKEVVIRTGKDANILNNHPEVKEKFFSTFTVTDSGGKINHLGPPEVLEAIARGETPDLGKVKVTTEGVPPEKSTTFTLGAVPNAELLEDGSLRIKKISEDKSIQTETVITGAEDFAVKKDETGKEVMVLTKGIATVKGEVPKIEVKEGKVAVPNIYKNGHSVYEGTFTVKSTTLEKFVGLEEGLLIEGKFSSYENHIRPDGTNARGESIGEVDGIVFQPKKESTKNFILLSGEKETTFKKTNGVSLTINSPEGVYYTENTGLPIANFCNSAFSCIVNNPGSSGNPEFNKRLAFLNVQKEDKIDVKTPVYYDHLEVLDQKNGEVSISSVDKSTGKTLSKTTLFAGGDIVLEGKMQSTKAGRFDVTYKTCEEGDYTHCEQTLHHWSSNHYLADQTYFNKPTDHFLTCTVGVDCERQFAENFGRIIPPNAKTVSTTVIVAGDNTYTARSLQTYCRTKGGCYIFNSRDVPPTTDSKNIVITGHHGPFDTHLYRNGVSNTGKMDEIEFNCETGFSPFGCLPEQNQEKPVETITFSACNTALSGENAVTKALSKKYPQTKSIQGAYGKAPINEDILTIPTTEEERRQQAREWGKNRRAWLVKQEDESWSLTDGKVEMDSKPAVHDWQIT
ncbi:MAG: hypothetical protein AABW48_05300 [Nanoarchaeota archaeon]